MSNIGWVYGILKHEHNVETDGMTPEEAFEKLRELERSDYKKSKKHIELPKKEYAELCGAIRTKFADRIPEAGGILYENSYYRYTYAHSKEQILCREKYEIIGNEERTAVLEEIYHE